MKTKLLITGVVAGLVTAVALPLAVMALPTGPSCTVDDSGGADYLTIQAAVSDPVCSTIKVFAGNYIENVVIARSLTIKGAKAGVNVAGRTLPSAAESNVTGLNDSQVFDVRAKNVTIDGFAITNPSHGIGVLIKTAGKDSEIKNNIIDSIGGPSYSPNTVGIYLENGPDNVKIERNRISNIQSTPSAQGILVGDSTSTDPAENVRIINNEIKNILSTRGAYGINVNNGATSASSPNTSYTTVSILGNAIHDLTGGWDTAIGLEGSTPRAIVKNNTISRLLGVTPFKLAVHFEDNPFFFLANISRNSLDVGSAAAGIFVNPDLSSAYAGLSANGTCNWWGKSDGPRGYAPLVTSGTGSVVTAGVDFNPWLKSSDLNGKCGNDDHHDDNDHHVDRENDN